MKIIDAFGMQCPKPLVLAKKEIDAGCRELSVQVDNETAVKNGIAVAAATVRAHVPEVIAERVASAPASASAAVGAEEKGEAATSDAR